MKTPRALLLVVVATLPSAPAGCGDDGGAAPCDPGETRPCECEDGASGAEECQDDGSWGDCVCAGGDADADTDGDSDGDSDSDGDTDGPCDADTDPTGEVDTACASDGECTASGLTCNESWGICVVPSCAGRSDFTACEIVTEPDRSYDICIGGECLSPGCGTAACNAPGPQFPMPDTNQLLCYDTEGSMTCPPEGEEYFGQDGQYGWDVASESSPRFTRDLEVVSEPVVLDNATGLEWQGCPAGVDESSAESCGSGSAETLVWSEALAYCDGLSWAGRDDWRLPDRYELFTIITFGGVGIPPSINHQAFPGTPDAWPAEFWTSSTCSGDTDNAWRINFYDGLTYDDALEESKSDPCFVRCVRGGTRRSGSLHVTTEEGDPVVEDTRNGLQWQGCIAGLSGVSCESGEEARFTWRDALSYCADLSWGGYSDWRLPNAVELFFLVDDHLSGPCVDTDLLPASSDYLYWTSSTVTGSPQHAWQIHFYSGATNVSEKVTYGLSARCVRCGPWSATDGS